MRHDDMFSIYADPDSLSRRLWETEKRMYEEDEIVDRVLERISVIFDDEASDPIRNINKQLSDLIRPM